MNTDPPTEPPFDPGFFHHPHWIFLIDPADGHILQQNNGSFLGYPTRHFTDFAAMQALIYPAEQEQAAELFAGKQENAGFRLQTAAGNWVWLHGHSFWMEPGEQACACLAVMLRQVLTYSSASPRSQQAEQALLEQIQQTQKVASFLEQLNCGTSLGQVLSTACAEISHSLGIDYCVVLLYDPVQQMLNVARYHTNNPLDPGVGVYQGIPRSAFDAMRRQMGDVMVIPDVQLFPGMVAEELLSVVNVRTLVLTPIEQEAELLGALTLVSIEVPREFNEDELALMQAYAHQLTEVIIRARLLNLAQRQARQLELLNHIARVALESSSLNEMLDALTCSINEHLQALGCMVVLWNEELGQLMPISGCGNLMPELMGITLQPGDLDWIQQILEAGKIRYFHQISPLLSPNILRQLPEKFLFPSALLVIPLRINERMLGFLMAGFDQPHPGFSGEDLYSWQEVADQLSLAIEKLKLLEKEQQRRTEAETLQRATAALAGQLDLPQVLDNILTCLAQVVPMDNGLISMLEEGGMRIVASHGLAEWFSSQYEGQLIPDDFGLFVLLKASNEPVMLNNTLPFYPSTMQLVNGLYPASWMGTSLVAFGKRIGYLTVGNWKPDTFCSANVRQMQLFAQQAAIAINNARLFEQVRQGRQQMEALSQRLVEVQEEERRTLARELHDEIGQVLTGLAYTLEMARRLEGPALHQILVEAQDMLATLTRQVREMSLNLRPSVLDDLGLQVALEWLVARFQQQTGIHIEFYCHQLPAILDSNIAITAFRVLQEALTNCARHANVSEVSAWAMVSNNEIIIQVEDHGQGFEPQTVAQRHTSSGLTGMAERVRLVGGRFQVLSEPGQGTQIIAMLPVK